MLSSVESITGRAIVIRIVCSVPVTPSDKHINVHRSNAAAKARKAAAKFHLGSVRFSKAEQTAKAEIKYTYLAEYGLKKRVPK